MDHFEHMAMIQAMDKIAKLAAQVCEGKDWHTLNQTEQGLVAELEKVGYLSQSQNGFVGRASKQD
jgi:hypothetical protein